MREPRLVELCEGDDDLQDAVESMLSEPGGEATAALGDVLPEGFGGSHSVGARPEPADLREGDRLGDRYRVVRRLGRGGMGDVYLARDLELRRDVAIKFIRHELIERADVVERFRREIELASRVTHPNVLRVYDLGHEDGRRFLTMQYVEGRELTDVLLDARGEDGPLPWKRAVHLFRQIVAGTASAHERRLIHRDLKPQNVLVDADDHVYLTDFGLSRAVDQSKLTQTGAVVGTPIYMSPEQVRGEEVDASTDVFALGVILHQMLSGATPYAGGSVFEIMMRRLSEPLPPLKECRPDAPKWLQRIVDRATAVDRSLRYASASELLEDLETEAPTRSILYEVRRRGWGRRLATAIVVAVLAFAGWKLATRDAPPDPAGPTAAETRAAFLAEVPRVGILPVANRTGDDSIDWSGEALARLIGDRLAQSRHLQVVSTEKLASIIDGAADDGERLQRLADAGIDYVAIGERRGDPDSSTLAFRLLEPDSGDTAASRTIEALDDASFLAAADPLARAFREGMEVPLEEQVEFYAADFAASNPEAYRAYVEGLGAYEAFDYAAAEAAFERATTIEEGFAMAHLRRAQILAETGRTREAEQALARAESRVDALDPREHAYLTAEAARLRRDNAAARDAYERLLEAFPYEIEARHLLGLLRLDLGDPDGARDEASRLLSIDDNNGAAHSLRGHAALATDPPDYPAAVQSFERYVELNPDEANGHHVLGDTYRRMREPGLAAERYRRALEVDPDFHFSTLALAQHEWTAGNETAALERWTALAESDAVAPRFRLDAAFEASYADAGRGRFRSAASRLERREALLREEGVREAMALAYRGLWAVEVGDLEGARRAIDRSIERAPSAVKTRYLFARGILELAQGDTAAVSRTAAEIRAGALPPDDPDRTEDLAAAYLEARSELARGEADGAIARLREAFAADGYEYAGYRVALAEAFAAAGRTNEALAELKQFLESEDPASPRIDLEVDRERARLLEIELRTLLGDRAAADAARAAWLERWRDADPDAALLRRAREL